MELTAAKTWSSTKAAFQVMLDPGGVVGEMLAGVPAAFSLCIPALAFTLLFLQAGLDMHRAGVRSSAGVVGLTFLGTLYGLAGIALVAAAAWAAARALGSDCSLGWTLRAFGIGYTPSLIYAACGLFFNAAFGWNTAATFGVTGLLWSMSPLMSTGREILGGRLGLSVLLATVCGGLLLFGWAILAI
ncbi:MAG: hypothetical protein AB1384_08470 [Actinomycetota bacterium]